MNPWVIVALIVGLAVVVLVVVMATSNARASSPYYGASSGSEGGWGSWVAGLGSVVGGLVDRVSGGGTTQTPAAPAAGSPAAAVAELEATA